MALVGWRHHVNRGRVLGDPVRVGHDGERGVGVPAGRLSFVGGGVCPGSDIGPLIWRVGCWRMVYQGKSMIVLDPVLGIRYMAGVKGVRASIEIAK